MKKKVFDLYISLGAVCSCTTTLRDCALQFYSYPFDWMAGSDLQGRTEILINDFKNWFNKEDLIFWGNRTFPEPRDIFLNTKTGIVHNHDFKYNTVFKHK